MRFPGRRKYKHYFPIEKKSPLTNRLSEEVKLIHPYIVGIDQTLVDIEANVDLAFLESFNLRKAMSQVIDEETAAKLTSILAENNMVDHRFAGGTIGNTLHNYSVLADDRSVMLGIMTAQLEMGSDAYRYLCNTSSRVDLEHLQPVEGPIGRNFTLITEDGERTFAFSPGWGNRLESQYVDKALIQNSAALVISAYLMRCEDGEPMPEATMKAVEYANQANVPVVLTTGTKFLIEQDPQWWRSFIDKHVNILAMNEEEGLALTGFEDPLLSSEAALDLVDLVLCTAGSQGLFLAGYCDEDHLRKSHHPLLPGTIPDFNRYEFSRPMRKRDCASPQKVYSHISPYMGGPDKISNTNGAGDGALAALLHDITANVYHRANVQASEKQNYPALAYSSFAQICKYANRVSYEVLMQHSPRLSRGLPERENNLEQAYWEA